MRIVSPNEFRKRKAVTGVLATIIMFSMIFTVLFGFLIYDNAVNLQNTKASDQRQAEVQQQSAENLVLGVGFKSAADPWGQIGDLWVVVNNTGSVAATVVDLYVTNVATGKLLSNSVISPGSPYLTTAGTLAQKGDLNLNLPLSISAGGSTATMTGCTGDPYHCDIAISQQAYNYVVGTFIQVSAVTSTGNVFTAQYPPHIPAASGFATNPLVLSLVATPPQTLSCTAPNCITVTATIYNYATAKITNVQLAPNAPTAQVTGTAGVSAVPTTCSGPNPSSTIAAFTGGVASSVTFTCTFSATTGAVGGFASFTARATGTLNAAPVSSAQEISNSVQIGGTVSVLNQGPFSADSFFFKDTYCSFTAGHFWVTPCSQYPTGTLSISTLPNANPQNASSNFYVAYYLHVTNNFNTTLYVLQYSYFQTDPSLGGESDFYIVGDASSYNTNGYYFPSYQSAVPTLTAYGGDALTCQTNPGACISIPPGGSIYLTFASCKAGSTSWNWGDSQYGRAFDNPVDCSPQTPPNYQTPEATYLSIVLSFLYQGQVFDQQIPFQGETIFGGANQPASCSTGNYCGTVVYTQYTGSVGYFNFVYNPTAGTFKIPTRPYVINNNLPYGTDGVVYNPQDHKLLLGTNQPNDQSVHFNEVDPNTGAVTTYNNNANTYSLNVMVSSDGTRVYMDGDGCNGGGFRGGCAPQSSNLAWAPLTPTVGNAVTTLTLSGSDTVLNTVVFVSPTLAYYVAELSPQFKGQTGHVGTLNPQTGVTTCFKTGSSCTVYDGVHGMVYDPFTKDLIVFGSNIVSQIDPFSGAIISIETINALDPNNGNFDQGAVDGFGHLFVSWAGSPGYIYFEDYSSGTIRNGTFNDAITNGASCSVIGGACILNGGQNSLGNPDAFDSIDDLAPIVGPGSQG